jgi:hypothetical protein
MDGSDKGGSDAARGSDEAKNHFPSLPARANQEAELIPTPRYGRGSDLEVILEVIGSADRLPFLKPVFFFQGNGHCLISRRAMLRGSRGAAAK